MNKAIPSVLSLLALTIILVIALKSSIDTQDPLPPIKSEPAAQHNQASKSGNSSEKSVQISEIPQTSKLGARIYTSLQNPNMQWWFNLPPNSTPNTPKTNPNAPQFHPNTTHTPQTLTFCLGGGGGPPGLTRKIRY